MAAPADRAWPAWVVVVPVKNGDVAKSRLTGLAAPQRSALARAFPADCVQAVRSVSTVRRIVVVTDDPVAARALSALGAEVVPDAPSAGLNAALLHACDHVRQVYGDQAVAALSGDLPALRADELATALQLAGHHPRAFVGDQDGDGTTLLTALAGVELRPEFGPGSAERHRRSGAVALQVHEASGLRRDVDTPAHLRAAVDIGVGRHTRSALACHGIRLD